MEGDAVKVVADIISGGWTAANADNITPNFYISSEQPKRLDYTFSSKTNVLFYLAAHTIKPNDLGASYKEETSDRISIDIRTRESRDHLRNCYAEAKRIVGTKTNAPHADYPYLESVEMKDFSTIDFHRYVYDVRLRNWVVAK